jgi:hypothetical protein
MLGAVPSAQLVSFMQRPAQETGGEGAVHLFLSCSGVSGELSGGGACARNAASALTFAGGT